MQWESLDFRKEGLLSELIVSLNLTYQIQEDKIKALSQKDIFIEVTLSR